MKKTRLLVIDDDPAMLSLARFELLDRGYEVATAQCGEEALRLLESESFDLAITDLQLPDLTGIEVVKRVKECALNTEIIIITGYSSTSQAVEAIRAGAFYFVEKPLDFTELQILIEKAVERRGQAMRYHSCASNWQSHFLLQPDWAQPPDAAHLRNHRERRRV
jgi:DNA-binding NtrC family response regulator